MKISSNQPKIIVLVVLVGAAAIYFFDLIDPRKESIRADVVIPELTALAKDGKVAFDKICASCHGANAAGTEKGPPFVNNIYNSGHHSDIAFYLAAKNGVPQHHWPFGNMPAQPQASDADLQAIIQYVREMQLANGIVAQPHKME